VQQVTAAAGKKLLCVGHSFCRVQVDAHEYHPPDLDLCAPQYLPSRRATAFNEKIIQIGRTNFHLMREARCCWQMQKLIPPGRAGRRISACGRQPAII
jgi:hypothetical protein